MPARPHSPKRELVILNAIASALNSAATAQAALDQTLAHVAELLGLHTGWVWLHDAESDRFYSAAALNLPPYLQEPVRMTGEPCWCLESFRTGKLTPSNIRLIQCSRLYPAASANDVAATQGLCCHASIPLYFGDRPLGVMNLTAPEWRELSAAELRLLATISYQVGVALERARLAEEGARLALAEERTRMAREIHDTLAQGLTAIGLHVESACRYVESDPALARARLDRALATVRESLAEARRSVLNLRAAPLDGRRLPEALGALARSFTAETGIPVRLRLGEVSPGLCPSAEAELFRIAQEALHNTRRHADATQVTVELTQHAGMVRLRVRDNGQGFERRTAAGRGHGIVGMRERARLLGGTLRLRSRIGTGTTVTAEIPHPPEGAA